MGDSFYLRPKPAMSDERMREAEEKAAKQRALRDALDQQTQERVRHGVIPARSSSNPKLRHHQRMEELERQQSQGDIDDRNGQLPSRNVFGGSATGSFRYENKQLQHQASVVGAGQPGNGHPQALQQQQPQPIRNDTSFTGGGTMRSPQQRTGPYNLGANGTGRAQNQQFRAPPAQYDPDLFSGGNGLRQSPRDQPVMQQPSPAMRPLLPSVATVGQRDDANVLAAPWPMQKTPSPPLEQPQAPPAYRAALSNANSKLSTPTKHGIGQYRQQRGSHNQEDPAPPETSGYYPRARPDELRRIQDIINNTVDEDELEAIQRVPHTSGAEKAKGSPKRQTGGAVNGSGRVGRKAGGRVRGDSRQSDGGSDHDATFTTGGQLPPRAKVSRQSDHQTQRVTQQNKEKVERLEVELQLQRERMRNREKDWERQVSRLKVDLKNARQKETVLAKAINAKGLLPQRAETAPKNTTHGSTSSKAGKLKPLKGGNKRDNRQSALDDGSDPDDAEADGKFRPITAPLGALEAIPKEHTQQQCNLPPLPAKMQQSWGAQQRVGPTGVKAGKGAAEPQRSQLPKKGSMRGVENNISSSDRQLEGNASSHIFGAPGNSAWPNASITAVDDGAGEHVAGLVNKSQPRRVSVGTSGRNSSDQEHGAQEASGKRSLGPVVARKGSGANKQPPVRRSRDLSESEGGKDAVREEDEPTALLYYTDLREFAAQSVITKQQADKMWLLFSGTNPPPLYSVAGPSNVQVQPAEDVVMDDPRGVASPESSQELMGTSSMLPLDGTQVPSPAADRRTVNPQAPPPAPPVQPRATVAGRDRRYEADDGDEDDEDEVEYEYDEETASSGSEDDDGAGSMASILVCEYCGESFSRTIIATHAATCRDVHGA